MSADKNISLILNTLRSSTQTTWNRGDLDDYRDWAFRMRSAINNTAPILEVAGNEIASREARIRELEAVNAEKDKIILALAIKTV